jgi:hypothetical protein
VTLWLFFLEAWRDTMKVLKLGFIFLLLLSLAEGEEAGGVVSENPHWSRLTSDRVSVFFRPGYEGPASEASDVVEAVYEEVAMGIGYEGAARVRVFLPPSDEAFNRLTGARIPDWGGGCAFPERGVIVIRASSEGSARLREVLRHELSHVFLRRALGEKRVPRWFDEGVAMRQSGEWRMEQTLRMARAVLLGRMVALDRIGEMLSFRSSKAQLAYVESYLAVLFLCELGGQDAPRKLVRAMRSGLGFEEAFAQVAGIPVEDFSEAWERYAKDRYNLVLVLIEGPWFWMGVSALFLGIYLTKRIRTRRVVRTWEMEEATWE